MPLAYLSYNYWDIYLLKNILVCSKLFKIHVSIEYQNNDLIQFSSHDFGTLSQEDELKNSTSRKTTIPNWIASLHVDATMNENILN